MQKLEIKDETGTASEISYSVENYIKDATSKDDTHLLSLMNAIHDYGAEASRYANPKPLYVKYDSSIKKESALRLLGLLTIPIRAIKI